LGVNPKSGWMIMKGGSKRADTCIKVFGLNKRDQLVKERKGAMEEVKAMYAGIIFGSKKKAAECRKELDLMERGHLSHTLARRAQIREIKERRGAH
jgi:hypothetical protein